MEGDTITMQTYFTYQGCRVTIVNRNDDTEIILSCDERPDYDVE
jgi:hypothetical protein